jgi:hypothetical protein
MELLVLKDNYFTMPKPHQKQVAETIFLFYTNSLEIINKRLPARARFSLEDIINFAYEEYLNKDIFEMAKAVEDMCVRYKLTLDRNKE